MSNLPQRLDLGNGPISRVILTLAVPSMISMFFQNLYALVDTMFISWLGTVPLAAQSLAVPLFYLALSLGKGIQVGTVTLMSQARGREEEGEARLLAGAALPLLHLCILPLLLLLIPEICNAFFSLLGATGEVSLHLYSYTFWMILSFPVMAYVMICEAILMSHGDTVNPMKAMLLGNGANIILDPLFMFTLGWGIAGASIATLAGQLVAAFFIRSRLKQAGLTTPSVKWRKKFISRWKQIGGLGFFVAVTYIVSPLGISLVNGVLATFGPAAVGAWNIMSRLEMMALLPLYGMAGALIPFMAFNFGQGKHHRIREGVRFCLLSSSVIVLPIMAIFIFLPHLLMFPFQADSTVRELGAYAIRTAALAHIFMPVDLALYGTSQGLKKPWYPLITSGMRLLFLRYPLALLFAYCWGIRGIYWSQPASMSITAMLSALLLWKLLKIIRREPAAAGEGPSPCSAVDM